MAIGIVPHYSVVFPLEGLTAEQFKIIVIDVVKKLGWNIGNIGHKSFIAYTKFRRTSRNEKISLQVDDGLVSLKSESQGGEFIDWGRNKRNVDDFISSYDEIRNSLSLDELNAKETEYSGLLNTGEEEILPAGANLETQSKGIFSLFIPVRGYFVTPIIIDINIIVFILMVMSGVNILQPATKSLLTWGANFRPYTLDGQSWRLFTNYFLHIGIVHLLFNMYALLYIGILLEPRLGSKRFGITYLVTGLLASIASLYWHPMTVSAGASGAIFGMYGVFLAMLTTNLIDKSLRKPMLTSIAVFVGYNLLNGMKGGIDNAAHIGGLVSGILIGFSMYPGLGGSNNIKLKFGLPAILIIALLGFSSWIYKRIPNDIVQYNHKIKSLVQFESKALEILRTCNSIPRDQLLIKIKNEGIDNWNEGEKLIVSLDKLNLPKEIHTRNEKLLAYCDLRIESYQLIYKSLDENTNIYNDQIRSYTMSIDSLLRTLK